MNSARVALRRRMAGLLVLAGLSLFLSSCGSGRKPVYPAHGQVFAGQHQPAAGALIIFHPVNSTDNDPNKPRAYVEADGSFFLTTYDEGDGAPAGEYVVTIIWKARPTSAFDPALKGPDKLGGRYSDAAKSKLRFTIEKQPDNALPAIEVQ